MSEHITQVYTLRTPQLKSLMPDTLYLTSVASVSFRPCWEWCHCVVYGVCDQCMVYVVYGVCGVWCMWCKVYVMYGGVWCMVYGGVCGVWCMWCMVYGVWCMVYCSTPLHIVHCCSLQSCYPVGQRMYPFIPTVQNL